MTSDNRLENRVERFLFAKSHFMTVCSVLITHRALFAFLMQKDEVMNHTKNLTKAVTRNIRYRCIPSCDIRPTDGPATRYSIDSISGR